MFCPQTPRGWYRFEDYSLKLARHFVRDIGPFQDAHTEIDEFAWQRAVVDGVEHDHTWIRKGQEVRTAAATVDGEKERVVGGLAVRRVPHRHLHRSRAHP